MRLFSITALIDGICLTQPNFCRCLRIEDETQCVNEGCQIKPRGIQNLCMP